MTINYPSMWELMADLRDMGESNAILGRRAQIPRDVLLSAEAIYKGESGLACMRQHEQSALLGVQDGARRAPMPYLGHELRTIWHSGWRL